MPIDPQDQPTLDDAAELFARAGALLEADRPADALEALDAAEAVYARLAEDGTDVAPHTAELKVRRGIAQLVHGHTASAVVSLDEASMAYFWLARGPGLRRFEADLARVLAINARVLLAGGDPDLAARSADTAIKLFIGMADRLAGTPAEIPARRSLRDAAALATMIHGARWNTRVAVEAAEIYVATARALAPLGAEDREACIIALVRAGQVNLSADRRTAGRTLLDEATTADRRTAEVANAEWAALSTVDSHIRDTVSFALFEAEEALGEERVEALLALTWEDPGVTVLTPSGRCDPSDAPRLGADLAALAVEMLPHDRRAALRLAVEANAMLAAASAAQGMTMRFDFRSVGVPWARMLLAFAAAVRDSGNAELAADLDGWLDAVAGQLAPFALVDPTVQALLTDVERRPRQS